MTEASVRRDAVNMAAAVWPRTTGNEASPTGTASDGLIIDTPGTRP